MGYNTPANLITGASNTPRTSLEEIYAGIVQTFNIEEPLTGLIPVTNAPNNQNEYAVRQYTGRAGAGTFGAHDMTYPSAVQGTYDFELFNHYYLYITHGQNIPIDASYSNVAGGTPGQLALQSVRDSFRHSAINALYNGAASLRTGTTLSTGIHGIDALVGVTRHYQTISQATAPANGTLITIGTTEQNRTAWGSLVYNAQSIITTMRSSNATPQVAICSEETMNILNSIRANFATGASNESAFEIANTRVETPITLAGLPLLSSQYVQDNNVRGTMTDGIKIYFIRFATLNGAFPTSPGIFMTYLDLTAATAGIDLGNFRYAGQGMAFDSVNSNSMTKNQTFIWNGQLARSSEHSVGLLTSFNF